MCGPWTLKIDFMRPSDCKKCRMRPLGQFEFETPVLEVDGLEVDVLEVNVLEVNVLAVNVLEVNV
jgi:hypothetical protein